MICVHATTTWLPLLCIGSMQQPRGVPPLDFMRVDNTHGYSVFDKIGEGEGFLASIITDKMKIVVVD